MKIILAIILLLLLINTIRNTPIRLSEKEYMKKAKYYYSVINRCDPKRFYFGVACIYLAYAFLYRIVGELSNNTYVFVFSILQSFSCLFNIGLVIVDENKYVFHRWWFLFLTIIDYIYYPVAIYMLLAK